MKRALPAGGVRVMVFSRHDGFAEAEVPSMWVCRGEPEAIDVDAAPLVLALFNWTWPGVRGYHFDPLFDLEVVRDVPLSWVVASATEKGQKRRRQALGRQSIETVGSKPGAATDAKSPPKAKAKVAKASPANAVSPPKAKARMVGVLPTVPSFPTVPVVAAAATAGGGAEQQLQPEAAMGSGSTTPVGEQPVTITRSGRPVRKPRRWP